MGINKADLKSWCESNFPYKIRWTGDDGVTRSPLRDDDKHPSFSVSLEGRCYHDFANGDKGTLTNLAERTGWNSPPWEPDYRPAVTNPLRKKEVAQEKGSEKLDLPTEEARKLWKASKPAGEHPYIKAKGISAFDCRVAQDGMLLVPARDIKTGEIMAVQRIAAKPDAEDRWGKFNLGGVKGNVWVAGNPAIKGPVVLCEGPSTAASVKSLVDDSASVLCVFSASNIADIAERTQTLHPDREIVLAVDNDEAGGKAAEEAGKVPGTLKVLPVAKRSDWNDRILDIGIEAARSEFQDRLGQARRFKNGRKFKLNLIGKLDIHEPEFIVHGLFETEALGELFGESGHCKSFLAIDLAASVATGIPFHGRATKQGPVIYLAGEGRNGLINRARAWEKHRGASLKGAPLALSSGKPISFFDDAAFKNAMKTIGDFTDVYGSPRLIIIDTLSRHFSGGEENSNSDMAQFANKADTLKDIYGSTVLIVHHSGHGDKSRGRGASALKGALDFEFSANKSGNHVELKSTKMKDAAVPEPLNFALETVEIGQTRKGEPITSAVLVENNNEVRHSKPLTAQQKIGLDSYRIAAEEAGLLDDYGRFAGLHLDAWRDQFYKTSTADSADAKRKSFQRARNALIQLGWLRVENNIYLPDSPNTIEGESLAKTLAAKEAISQGKQQGTDNIPGKNDVPNTQSAVQLSTMGNKLGYNKVRDKRDTCGTLSHMSQSQGTERAGRTGHTPKGVSHVPPVQPNITVKKKDPVQEANSSLRGEGLMGGLI